MMDGDGNLHDLNKYLSEQEEGERALEFFLEDAEAHIREIEDRIIRLRELASEYKGFDMNAEWKQQVMEFI